MRKAKQEVDWQTVGKGWEFYLEQAGDEWRDAFVPVIEGTIMAQGEAMNVLFGMTYGVRNLLAEQWLSDYILRFAQPILDTTSKDISAILLQAMAEGWRIPDMEERLGMLFRQYMKGDLTPEDFAWFAERMPAYRREMIARTETIRASNMGLRQLYAKWGVEKREWLATLDDRTRLSHVEANGQVRSLTEPFVVGGYRMMQPEDASLGAPPGEFVNCRCVVLPVVER